MQGSVVLLVGLAATLGGGRGLLTVGQVRERALARPTLRHIVGQLAPGALVPGGDELHHGDPPRIGMGGWGLPARERDNQRVVRNCRGTNQRAGVVSGSRCTVVPPMSTSPSTLPGTGRHPSSRALTSWTACSVHVGSPDATVTRASQVSPPCGSCSRFRAASGVLPGTGHRTA